MQKHVCIQSVSVAKADGRFMILVQLPWHDPFFGLTRIRFFVLLRKIKKAIM